MLDAIGQTLYHEIVLKIWGGLMETKTETIIESQRILEPCSQYEIIENERNKSLECLNKLNEFAF